MAGRSHAATGRSAQVGGATLMQRTGGWGCYNAEDRWVGLLSCRRQVGGATLMQKTGGWATHAEDRWVELLMQKTVGWSCPHARNSGVGLPMLQEATLKAFSGWISGCVVTFSFCFPLASQASDAD